MKRKIYSEATEKSKIIVNKCLEQGYDIGAAKADKLLILTHGIMLSKYQKPLFNQNVVAEKCGPIVREVERELLLLEIEQDNNVFEFYNKLPQYICLLQREEEVINEILKKYGNCDLVEIMNDKRLTVLKELCYKDDSSNIIPNKLIEKVFDYYQFYDFDIVKQNEESFIKRIKNN